MPSSYIRKILNAAIYDVVQETPIDRMSGMSRRLGNQVFAKREDLQPIFSFKIRGAYNKILALTPDDRRRGIITASAGNHAQGVALAANRMGIRAVIVVPVTTPQIKIDSVRSRGGPTVEVVLHGDCFDEACTHAYMLAERDNLVFVHPYDDPDVIAGQGTIGMEIIRQLPQGVDTVFIPVGGGGLLAGVAVYLKWVRPEIKIIGVEPDDAACLKAAFDHGHRVKLSKVGIFADGVAVAMIGEEPYRLAKLYVDEIVTVSTDEICAAIKDIFEDNRSIAEPAGAAALAGLKKYAESHGLKDQRLLFIESGANVNFGRLRYISQRADVGEGQEVLFAATIPERPGALDHFCDAIGGAAITEFNYRYSSKDGARIYVGLRMSSGQSKESIVSTLVKAGFPILDLTNNELAKEHVCHLIGGRPSPANERLFRFEFPERSGALKTFLGKMPKRWNISLFHYRNEGGSYGRVCVGMQIPPNDSDQVHTFLKEVNYVYVEETGNPAYETFLK